MEKLKRFGVSIEEGLLEKFDQYLKHSSYRNRSEAIRDLLRKELVEAQWLKSDEVVAGAIIMVYDHHQKELMDNLIHIQHHHQDIIISSQHIHMDQRMCMEIIVVKGKMGKVYQLESKLKAVKGVKHASLAKSTLGKGM
ncbi:MAG: nickel-responsive transcriptional regulator NikR [Actinomycetota bacterium]|nr:nickel-responsive transcriptional regulator NikR [Actinomycetota bacterium]